MVIMFTLEDKNIDLLLDNECNQDCLDCFFKESENLIKKDRQQDIETIEKLIKKFEKGRVFFYPKEPLTNLSLLKFYKDINQSTILTNGKAIGKNPEILDLLKNVGIKEIKFTLFANYEEQKDLKKISKEDYVTLKQTIKRASEDFNITIFNEIYRKNLENMGDIATLCNDLGVSKLTFLRLIPLGEAKNLPNDYFITSQKDGIKFVQQLQKLKEVYKRDNLYIQSIPSAFGPDFFSKRTKKYLNGEDFGSWTKAKNLCPAIDGKYLGVSVRTGKIYPCFKMISEPESQVGEIIDNELKINQIWVKSEDIKENIQGNCKKCDYLEDCLGGCRSVAYIFAKLKGEKDPLYAGMDICRTQIRKELGI
ncbi:radical SAM protein [Candidatus Woesearchaeota archaeon]|nr:radical SAM protein [Candidatus Woesearchaeota archaeon]